MALPIPSYRDIIDLLKRGATIEAQEKIMELREAALELQEENFGLREALKKAEIELSRQKAVRFDSRVYFVEGDPLPMCPYCYEAEKKLYHLSSPQRTPSGSTYSCPNCESEYLKKDDVSEYIFWSGRRRDKK